MYMQSELLLSVEVCFQLLVDLVTLPWDDKLTHPSLTSPQLSSPLSPVITAIFSSKLAHTLLPLRPPATGQLPIKEHLGR